jgi:hypothetical protein
MKKKLTKLRKSPEPTSNPDPDSVELNREDTRHLLTLAVCSDLSICPTTPAYSEGDRTNENPSDHTINQRVNFFVINSLEYLNRYKQYLPDPSIPASQFVKNLARPLPPVAHQLTNEPVVEFVPTKRTSTRPHNSTTQLTHTVIWSSTLTTASIWNVRQLWSTTTA